MVKRTTFELERIMIHASWDGNSVIVVEGTSVGIIVRKINRFAKRNNLEPVRMRR